MGLNSSGLDAFFICAQERSFTKAAARLHITQSALSQRIKNLESEMNTTLFIRDRQGATLTESGQTLLRYCQHRFQMEQELLGQVSENQKSLTGQLRVAGFSSVVRPILIPACQQLAHKHPEIQFTVFSREMNELFDLLRNASADLIVLDHLLDRDGLRSELLGFETNVRVRKRDTKFTGYFLDHDERDPTTLKYLKVKSGSKLKRHYLDEVFGIVDGVLAGLGDAVLPRHLIQNLKGLEIIDETRSLKNPVYAYVYDHPVPSRLMTAFMAEVKNVAEEILGADNF